MITQKQESNKELSTGQEVDTIYITDKELESLAQELTKQPDNIITKDIKN